MDIWAPRLPGADFLDLFAGSGAVGIEALSRGATGLMLIESAPQILGQLHETTRSLDLQEVRIEAGDLPADLTGRLKSWRRDFDLIFADPPYTFHLHAELIQAASGWLSPSGEMAVEHGAREVLPEACYDLLKVDERRYGDTTLSFYQ